MFAFSCLYMIARNEPNRQAGRGGATHTAILWGKAAHTEWGVSVISVAVRMGKAYSDLGHWRQ